MPRRARLNLTDIPQHIIQRGNNRQATFYADDDYRCYLHFLVDAARRYGCTVYAYVLMTNHVHLLASTHQSDGLSRMMQHLGRRFVRYINQQYQRSGTLWEGRFRASLVDTEAYFLSCCRYIECNPVRAQLVASPEEYPWSSYRFHAFGTPDMLVRAHECYERLGGTDGARQNAYRSLFRSVPDSVELSEIRNSTNRGWPLGGDRFKDEVARALKCVARPPKRGRPPKAIDRTEGGDLLPSEMLL